MLKTACGKVKSKSGAPFAKLGLALHQRDCKKCREILGVSPVKRRARRQSSWEPRLTMTSMILGDDVPDGAFFAFAHEIGEL